MLKFIGGGYLPGVPARDLTDEEARKFGGKPALIRSGLYKEISERAKSIHPKYENKAIVPAEDDKEE